MARLWRVGLILVGMAALGACKAQAEAPKNLVLDDFELAPAGGNRVFDPIAALRHPTYPNNDFDLATSGYATLSPVTKDEARAARDKPLYKFIQGKTAAKVRFTVPTDYRDKSDERFPVTWETGFGLSTDSRTPLKQTDWSAYRYLTVHVFNPGPLVQRLNVRFNDAASSTTRTAVLVPLGESELELPLDQLGAARLDLTNIRNVSFYLDTANQDADPVLLFDQLSLHDLDSATRIKLANEDGEDDSSDDDSWDDDSDTVRKINVVHPGDLTVTAAAQGVSPAAQ